MTNPDVGYRRILLGRAAVKIKLQALQSMTAASDRLLLWLIRHPETHPKVRLLASDMLKKRQQTKTIDQILRAESNRLEGTS